jgi:hypothetical protein
MAIVERYSCDRKNLGLLAILYPGVPVFKPPEYPPYVPFVSQTRIIVVSDDKTFRHYPGKEVIQITSSGYNPIDTRNGFLRRLPSRGVRATENQIAALRSDEYSDDEFWRVAKLACVLKKFAGVPRDWKPNKHAKMYRLFDVLFEDFDAVYQIFHALRKTGKSHTDIFCALLTMMTKARHLNARPVDNHYYSKLLRKNRRFTGAFRALVEDYLETDRDEMDLLGLLARCSAHTRPAKWPFIDEWADQFQNS